MLLLLGCLSPQGIYREYSTEIRSLEAGFDFLNALVNAGWYIAHAKLLEGSGQSLWLPVEAFDGAPMRIYVEALQTEWETLLRMY